MPPEKDVFFVCQGRRSFFETDRIILEKNFSVETHDRYPPSAGDIPRVFAGTRRSRLVFVWFLGKHAVLPLLAAKLLGKKTVLVAGGWDATDCTEIDYGLMRPSPLRGFIRLLFGCADHVLSISRSNYNEILKNTGIPANKVRLIYLGIKDAKRTVRAKEKRVVTVGEINRSNLKRKGLETFVRLAARFPDIPFVMIGNASGDGALEYLKSIASPNVEFAGFLTLQQLEDQMERAAVYAQFSFHEAFGSSVAEAMLHECVPVVTDRYSLPEVAGDTGYVVPYGNDDAAAEGLRKALEDRVRGPLARRRVLENFSYERREKELTEYFGELLP